MTHLRSGTFWASFIFASLTTMFALSFLWCIFGPEESNGAADWIGIPAYLIVSLGIAYRYARRQFAKRRPSPPGFPIIVKEPGDSAAP